MDITIDNEIITNQKIETSDFLNIRESHLIDCFITTRITTLNFLSWRTWFKNCTFLVKKELKNKRWLDVNLDSCTFKGKLTGSDFGNWPKNDINWENGGIVNCDFSEAILNGCRFINCDMSTMKLPKWPCINIMDPVENNKAFKDWEDRYSFGFSFSFIGEDYPVKTNCISRYAPQIIKDYGCTEEELYNALSNLDFVIM